VLECHSHVTVTEKNVTNLYRYFSPDGNNNPLQQNSKHMYKQWHHKSKLE